MEMDVMDLFAAASIVTAAQQTGLFRELLAAPQAASAHAEKLGLDRRATTLVLDALVTLELASREGDRYEASPQLQSWLRPWVGGNDPRQHLWEHTAAFLRSGEPLAHMDGTPAEREASYRAGVAWLGKHLEPFARELAGKLAQAPARVLDVGCGSGVWSLAIAERSPTTRVTGQDFPQVLESFSARAQALGLGDRVATIPGDMHAVELPAGAFDLVVIANVLRLETPERAASLLARLARAVAPGGALLVVDALAGGTPERERARALYALNLALRTRAGRVHSPAEFASWLTAAGLGAIETIELGGRAGPLGAVGALLARR
ncbi:class I SAM-dependent methyltransferase [Nannocystis sp. SCPEA4]|uniref:class I SAM-dependent methyltransferase n=1 Tax=Nannocystis sp. SCPEA4 TaxID=2996787 RepID=UPI00226EA478|nr:class I SAM-dependent methyltransferase [Nannocystis sp. SCPEA4]MCY1054791.1 class I SAM-dependent methyltransferase [Nannocystis sp. SCPEA4]